MRLNISDWRQKKLWFEWLCSKWRAYNLSKAVGLIHIFDVHLMLRSVNRLLLLFTTHISRISTSLLTIHQFFRESLETHKFFYCFSQKIFQLCHDKHEMYALSSAIAIAWNMSNTLIMISIINPGLMFKWTQIWFCVLGSIIVQEKVQ